MLEKKGNNDLELFLNFELTTFFNVTHCSTHMNFTFYSFFQQKKTIQHISRTQNNNSLHVKIELLHTQF